MASTSHGIQHTSTSYLKRIIGNPVGQLYPLVDSSITVGRNNQSEICLQDPNISRNHCSFSYSTGGWFITDLGGVNGTFHDGVRLTPKEPCLLKDGAIIYLGPPQEAPFAFVFLSNEQRTQVCGHDLQVKIDEIPEQNGQNIISASGQQTMKRKCKDGHTTGQIAVRKKTAPSPRVPKPYMDSTEDSDCGSLNCSISSLDSLSTRIRKQGLKEDPKLPRKRALRKKRKRRQQMTLENQQAMSPHEDLFDLSYEDSDSSEKKSESLLKDDFIPINCLSPPLSKKLSTNSFIIKLQQRIVKLQKEANSVNEKLKQVSSAKVHLSAKLKIQEDTAISKDDLRKALEEELNCNICFNIVVKATTLGCSHTFCNHCIMD